jgi:transcription initiation factor IIE alpha subunit
MTNDTKSVASLVYWRDGVSVEEAQKIMNELVDRGLVQCETTRDYQSEFGSPVWYIP